MDVFLEKPLSGCRRFLKHQGRDDSKNTKAHKKSLLVVRSKRKGGNILTIPTKLGSFTWCSGTSFSASENLPAGTIVDVLLDEETTNGSNNESKTITQIDISSEAAKQSISSNTKDGSRLYYFLIEDRHLITRPEAIAYYGAVLLGHRIAPLSEEEIFNAPDDPSAHRADKEERAGVFADWLIHTFGLTNLCNGSGIIDIAGGRGNLSAELLERYSRIKIEVQEQEDQEQKQKSQQLRVTLVEPELRKDIPAPLLNNDNATIVCNSFDEKFANDHLNLLENASLLVGLHPDQATEAIVDVALSLGIPFAVVPCCVFPKLFPQRRLTSGQRVKNCGGSLRYLRAKHVDIETALLAISKEPEFELFSLN